MGSWLSIAAELTKARISLAVAVSAATGYLLFRPELTAELGLASAGVWLLSCGASALNQVQEARIDARMERTRARPIPSGRLRPDWALFFSLSTIGAGLNLLALIESHTETLLALGAFALLWYNGVYVTLKRASAFAAVPGALIGAVPPMIGWVAAGGLPDDPTILEVAFFFFLWQVPHFWLLLLRFGAEYEAAGLPSLTRVFTPRQIGRITFVWIVAVAACGALLGLSERIAVPWRLGLLAASGWLAARSLPILAAPRPATLARPAFITINLYALAVMALLVGGAIW